MNRYSSQYAVPRVSPVVKVLLIVSAVVFFLSLVLERAAGISLTALFGFTPARLAAGFVWQPFTYVFLHATFFHLLFNLLVIWTVGSELEDLWGRKTFLGYLLVCGVGAALTYGLFSLVGIGPGPNAPVVGSSGIVYGLLLAYGILFGDRTMYFFMLFPMPARYFVMLLGAVELVSSVFYSNTGVAHLAHLGGMAFGFLFLVSMARWRKREKVDFQARQAEKERQKRLKKAGHLKLVREDLDEDDPKHWN
jgi:membrane associated rhomboid family serine protease